MDVQSVKKWKDQLILPFVRILNMIGFSPNGVTIISFLFGFTGCGFLLAGNRNMFGLLVLLSYAFDGLDGGLARYQKKATSHGKMLDWWSDRIITVTIMITLFVTHVGILFLLLPLLYIPIHLTYRKKPYYPLYMRGPYYILAYFHPFSATLLGLGVVAVNIIRLATNTGNKLFKR